MYDVHHVFINGESFRASGRDAKLMQALADAPQDDVVKTWYPLGYNIRPRRLHSIAREAVDRHGGRLPDDEATLRSFKGIVNGDYDHLPEQAFSMVGAIEEAEEKAKKLQ